MTERPKRRRDAPMPVRLKPEAKLALEVYKQRLNMSGNAVVNHLLVRQKVHLRAPGEEQAFGKMLFRLGQIRTKLQDVSLSGPDNAVLLLEQIRDELILIRNAIFRCMGRKP